MDAVASVTVRMFFVFIFLCQIPSDAVFIAPVADRLGRAFGGLLYLNMRRIKFTASAFFIFFEIIF